MSSDEAPARRGARWWPADGEAPLPWFLELLGLTGLLIAQPLYEIYRDGADTFVWQRADSEIVWWALGILLLPALVVLLPVLAVRWWLPGAASTAQAVLIGTAGGALAARTYAQLAVEPGANGASVATALGAIAVFVGGLAALARVRWAGFRSWLRILAIGPVVLCSSFLLSSPVRDIAFAQGTGATVALDLEDPPPVLFLIFDELPLASMLGEDDRIDPDLLPNFARLAERSTLYRNISTVSPSSPTAVPALLTGTYPTASDVPPISDNYPRNLFTLLAATYEMNVWESVAQLCPPDQCSSDGASVSGLLADAARTWWEGFLPKMPAEQEAYKPPQSQPSAPNVFADFLHSLPDESSGEPRLDYLHIIFPHQPWYYLPSGARHSGPFLAPGLMGSTYAWGDDYLAQAGRQRHLLQLVRADQLLGDLLDRMEAAGTFDNTLIVITADHGAAFESGEPIRGVSEANAAQVMWVPLFIKVPGQTTAVIDDTPGRTLDVLPTLATLLDAEVPWELDGVALDEPRPADVEQRRMLEWAFNALQPTNGEHYVTIDGEAAFADLLALPPATEPGDDPLKPWRFGRWGHLVGELTEDLRRTEPTDLRVDLDDPECARAKSPYSDAVPVYFCGTIEGGESIDVIVAVNGYIGGWGRTRPMKQEGKREFFVLVPDDLLDESDDIEVFQAISDLDAPGKVLLAPIELVDD